MIVGSGQDRQPNDSGILLQRSLDDLLGRLAQTCIDDLHAFIAKRTRNHFCAPVMTIEARFCDDDADLVHS